MTKIRHKKGHEGQQEQLLQMTRVNRPQCCIRQGRGHRKKKGTQCLLPRILLLRPAFRNTRPPKAVGKSGARKTYCHLEYQVREYLNELDRRKSM